MSRKWLTTRQVADDLGCHVQTVRAIIRSGQLVARKLVSRGANKRPHLRVEPVELERFKMGSPTTEKLPVYRSRRRSKAAGHPEEGKGNDWFGDGEGDYV